MTLTTKDPESLQENAMKRRPPSTLPLHDYDLARESALSWLGQRYLLAEPINRRREEPSPFYVQPRQWHVVVPRGALRVT
jgi:hypothetical protein